MLTCEVNSLWGDVASRVVNSTSLTSHRLPYCTTWYPHPLPSHTELRWRLWHIPIISLWLHLRHIKGWEYLSKTQATPWHVAYQDSLISFPLTCEVTQKYHSKLPVSVEFHFSRNRQITDLEWFGKGRGLVVCCQILHQSLTLWGGSWQGVTERYRRIDLAHYHRSYDSTL